MSISTFHKKGRNLYEINKYMSTRRFKYNVDYVCVNVNDETIVKFITDDPPENGIVIHCKEKNTYRFIFIEKYVLIESSNVLGNLMIDMNRQYLFLELDTNVKFKNFELLIHSIYANVPASPEFLFLYNFFDMQHLLFSCTFKENELNDFLGDYDIGPLRDLLICKPVKTVILDGDMFVTLTNQGNLIIWNSHDQSSDVPYKKEWYTYNEKYIINIYVVKDFRATNQLLMIDERNTLSFYKCTNEQYVDIIKNANPLRKKIVQVKIVNAIIICLYDDGTIECVLGIKCENSSIKINFPSEFTDGTIRINKIFASTFLFGMISDDKVYLTIDGDLCMEKESWNLNVKDITKDVRKILPNCSLSNIVKMRTYSWNENIHSILLLDKENVVRINVNGKINFMENVRTFFTYRYDKVFVTHDNRFFISSQLSICHELQQIISQNVEFKKITCYTKFNRRNGIVSVYRILSTRDHKIHAWKHSHSINYNNETTFDLVKTIKTPFM